jgi:hypothetical protein
MKQADSVASVKAAATAAAATLVATQPRSAFSAAALVALRATLLDRLDNETSAIFTLEALTALSRARSHDFVHYADGGDGVGGGDDEPMLDAAAAAAAPTVVIALSPIASDVIVTACAQLRKNSKVRIAFAFSVLRMDLRMCSCTHTSHFEHNNLPFHFISFRQPLRHAAATCLSAIVGAYAYSRADDEPATTATAAGKNKKAPSKKKKGTSDAGVAGAGTAPLLTAAQYVAVFNEVSATKV